MADDTTRISEHVSVWIDVPARDAYTLMADVSRLPEWAAGLADSRLRPRGDHWIADSPMGEVTVVFAPPNDFGIVDHVVTLPTGEAVDNPVRVIAAGDSCEVVFTVRHRPTMTDDEFRADVAAVTRDLEALKRLLETQRSE
jgi:hypothetical protein